MDGRQRVGIVVDGGPRKKEPPLEKRKKESQGRLIRALISFRVSSKDCFVDESQAERLTGSVTAASQTHHVLPATTRPAGV